MLYFDSALELQGLTIFRDYNTPTRFYYMPRAPLSAIAWSANSRSLGARPTPARREPAKKLIPCTRRFENCRSSV